jgi:hypothetical protein
MKAIGNFPPWLTSRAASSPDRGRPETRHPGPSLYRGAPTSQDQHVAEGRTTFLGIGKPERLFVSRDLACYKVDGWPSPEAVPLHMSVVVLKSTPKLRNYPWLRTGDVHAFPAE